MTSLIEIENYLKDQKGYFGSFASNDLPSFPRQLPASLIINTHKKNQPGGVHWLALVLNKHKCFYFDSSNHGRNNCLLSKTKVSKSYGKQ